MSIYIVSPTVSTYTYIDMIHMIHVHVYTYILYVHIYMRVWPLWFSAFSGCELRPNFTVEFYASFQAMGRDALC